MAIKRNFSGTQHIIKLPIVSFDSATRALVKKMFPEPPADVSNEQFLFDLSTFNRGWRTYIVDKGVVEDFKSVESEYPQPKSPAGNNKKGVPAKWFEVFQINAVSEKGAVIFEGVENPIIFNMFADVYDKVGPIKVIGIFKGCDASTTQPIVVKPTFEFYDFEGNQL
jgi:hypothetical protein